MESPGSNPDSGIPQKMGLAKALRIEKANLYLE